MKYLMIFVLFMVGCGSTPQVPVVSTEGKPVRCDITPTKPNGVDFTGESVFLDTLSLGTAPPGMPFSAIQGAVDNFSMRCETYVYFSTPGVYEFKLTADDSASLYVDQQLVVSGSGSKTLTIDSRSVGVHTLVVLYTQTDGSKTLNVEMRGPGSKL